MGKQPYIPLYIGDWEKDTNTISLEAEGALLKLIFKLWDSADKGQLTVSFQQLSILLKKGQDLSLKILKELHENRVLDMEFLPNESVKIKSRRMLKDIEKSRVASENGKLGGRPKKAKQKLTESKTKATSDIDSVNEYENKKEKEGKKFDLVFPYGSEKFLKLWNLWVEYRIEAKKPYHTFTNQQGALQRLQKLAGDDEEKAIAIIHQSIERNWINFFEILNNGKQTNNGKNTNAANVAASAFSRAKELRSKNYDSGDPVG